MQIQVLFVLKAWPGSQRCPEHIHKKTCISISLCFMWFMWQQHGAVMRVATHSCSWALTWTVLLQVVKAFPSESFHSSSLSIPLYLLFSIHSLLFICIFFYLYSTLTPTRASSLPAAEDCRVKLLVSCLRCAADVLCLCPECCAVTSLHVKESYKKS